MTHIVEEAVSLLVAAGIGVQAGTSGWRIEGFKMPEGNNVPDTAIAVYHAPGRAPNPRWLLDFPSLQIRVRGAPHQPEAAYNKAQAIKDALLGIDSQDVGTTRWVSVTMSSDIVPLGLDAQGRSQWVLNFNLITEPASGTHRVAL